MPCARCNSGWMNQLEMATRPILTPMIRGEATALDDKSCVVVAGWAIKTAMVLEYVNSGIPQYYTLQERRDVMDNLIPPKTTLIWTGQYVGTVRHHCSLLHVTLHDRGGRTAPGHCATIVFGRVILQVFSYRVRESRVVWLPANTIRPWETALWRIWPPARGLGLMWPPSYYFNDHGLTDLSERFVTRWE